MYVENHAQANSVRAKQLAGQRLSQEEEAILEQEGTLEAELRKEREEQERLKSRADAVARSVTVSNLLGSAIVAAAVFCGMKALGGAVNKKGGSVDRLGASIERAADGAVNKKGGSVDRLGASIERAADKIRILRW